MLLNELVVLLFIGERIFEICLVVFELFQGNYTKKNKYFLHNISIDIAPVLSEKKEK